MERSHRVCFFPFQKPVLWWLVLSDSGRSTTGSVTFTTGSDPVFLQQLQQLQSVYLRGHSDLTCYMKSLPNISDAAGIGLNHVCTRSGNQRSEINGSTHNSETIRYVCMYVCNHMDVEIAQEAG